MRKFAGALGALALAGVLHAVPAAAQTHPAGPTVGQIVQRGHLICGTNVGRQGFSSVDSQGRWWGFDVDFCKAIAVAIFGDPSKVRYVALSSAQRFPALQSGEVDILSRNTTWTLTRDTQNGFDFAIPNFYSGSALMVPRALNVTSARQLDGATVCVFPGSTTERYLADFARRHNITFRPVVIENVREMTAAYLSGRCDVNTQDATGLISIRALETPNPNDHIILPEMLSKEPLAITMRQGDAQFRDLISWVVMITIEGEEQGITSANIDNFANSQDPHVRRLLGLTPGIGRAFGIDDRWAYNVLKQVGNYAEIFDRNVGKDSPLRMERGLNGLWNQGGLLYSYPIN